jgi:hypothetical protein
VKAGGFSGTGDGWMERDWLIEQWDEEGRWSRVSANRNEPFFGGRRRKAEAGERTEKSMSCPHMNHLLAQ